MTETCASPCFSDGMLDAARAGAVAASLGLRLDSLQVCLLCVYGVAGTLRSGDEREIRSAVRFFAPLLWQEGLERPVREALERARMAGVPDAATAASEVERFGATSRVVKEVVRDLAAQQLAELDAVAAGNGNGSRRRPGLKR